MKFCLIGCGGNAISCHIPAYRLYARNNPEFELSACCDIDESRARNAANSCGFKRVYTDYRRMLEVEKPNAVSIVVSEKAMCTVATYVLGQGIPCLIEKPPGQNSRETQSLIETAARSGCPNQVAFNRRYLPVLSELKRRVYSEISPQDVQLITYDMYRANRFDPEFSNTAIHGIDAVRHLASSDYNHVHFSYQELPQFGDGVCNIFMDCEMKSGARAILRFCPTVGAVIERASIHSHDKSWFANTPIWGGSDAPGYIECLDAAQPRKLISGSEICADTDVFLSNGFYGEIETFLNSILDGSVLSPSVAECIDDMLIKECIDRRAEQYSAD